MKRILLGSMVLLFVFTPAPAAPQQPHQPQQLRPYVDPALRALLRSPVREKIERLPHLDHETLEEQLPLSAGLALDRGPDGAARVGILVRLDEPRAHALAELRAAGAEIGTVIGDIVTATVPLDGIRRLGAANRLRTLEAARRIQIEHDFSIAAVRADRVRTRHGAGFRGHGGRGVIVGVIDTGVDYTHADFRDGSDRSRILALLDQPNGITCDRESLTDGSCGERDDNGHGTHTAGSAAGDGSATGSGGAAYRYAGMAPAADLLVVKTSFFTDDVVDAVNWIFDEAGRRGRPVVVNMSFGLREGPRDGTMLWEQALDRLAGPGRVLVASAGNRGSNGNATDDEGNAPDPSYIHAMTTPAADGDTDSFTFEVPAYNATGGSCNDGLILEVWYEGEDRVDITVERPDGSSATAMHRDTTIAAGDNGQIFIGNAYAPPGENNANPENGDYNALVVISDCDDAAGTASGPPQPGAWTVRTTATTASSAQPVHLWIVGSTFGATGADGFDNRFLMTAPATARNVIAVGAFVTRLSWPTSQGTIGYTETEEIGDLARFSGGGPTRDGRMKPEVTAPGLGIVSALSSDAASSFPPARIVADGVHAVIEGTSMSSPHVAGAVALMLQADPSLAPDAVRDVLRRSAAQDQFTMRTYDGSPAAQPRDWWGWGKLDVEAALEDMGALDGIAELIVSPTADTLPAGATVQLGARAFDGVGTEKDAAIVSWTSSHPSRATVDATGLVTGLSPGPVTITARTGDTEEGAEIQVVPPATLVVTADSLPAISDVSSAEGTRLSLLRVRLRADGYEAVRVRSLGFRLSGADDAAVLLLGHDQDRDGELDDFEPVLFRDTIALAAGQPTEVGIEPDSLVIPAQASIEVLVGLRLSGAVPNGARFRAEYLPDRTGSITARSRVEDRLDQPDAVVASGPARTTVLDSDEIFALSENPVRSTRVVFNFAHRPTVAAIYTLGGRQVRDLVPLLPSAFEGLRVEWDLTNDRGSPVAPGVYLVVFDVEGQLVREKLIVVRPAGASR